MAVLNLDKIFQPKSVAVIGASPTESSIGYTVLKNLSEGGFGGRVYPVNPKYERIGENQCYERVAKLPSVPDLAVVCTPAATTPGMVDECGSAGVRGMVILSAGFREMNEQGERLEQQLRDAAARYEGLRIIGPNCLGVMAPHAALNASFASGMPPRGRIAFISQSGALCTAVLDWALQEKVGFSHFVSVGNMIDVGIGDLIDYFGSDGLTDSIILYVESITDAREFISASRAFARKKPIIAYKAGRFTESAQAPASHTGAMAGVDAVYEAAFNRAGVVRVCEILDMFD
ncbi:MAG: CoA-binding protein, partial [Planctomycetales bacterium]|nr:CoA-binding protein [Planctomycetales bacterium]